MPNSIPKLPSLSIKPPGNWNWQAVLLFLTFHAFGHFATLPCHAEPDPNLPNIIVIFSDDQGMHDVSCYGSEIATPEIDKLAKEGMQFTQFYAASSICTPSRYGLLTGRYPHRSQDNLLGALMFLEERDQHRGLRKDEATYVERLKGVGYQTALVGKWHLGHGEQEFWPTKHGFDSFFGHTGGCVDFFTLDYGNRPDWYRNEQLVEIDGYATDVITAEAIQVLSRSRQNDQPLYLHVAYNAPHFGKAWNQEKQAPENVMQPKSEDLIKASGIADPLRRAFAAKVIGMDEGIGKLLKEVERLGISENTLVIFMTDHGGDPKYGGSNLPFRGGKATLFEGGIRVPCIARWPNRITPGSASDQPTGAIDLHATFSEITGFKIKQTDGVSLLPILLGKSSPTSRTLIWRTGSHESLQRKSWAAVRDGDWKWVQQPGQEKMLFNLRVDPHETQNLAGIHTDIAHRLQKLAQ
jgi:arylsulfatase A-like enzyme